MAFIPGLVRFPSKQTYEKTVLAPQKHIQMFSQFFFNFLANLRELSKLNVNRVIFENILGKQIVCVFNFIAYSRSFYNYV